MQSVHANEQEPSMRIELNAATLQLARGQVLRLADAAGRTLCSTGGAVWVTEDELRNDVVLEAGACHRLRGSALVQALSPATFSLA
jgi:Protein of unknown function (DUF2917)